MEETLQIAAISTETFGMNPVFYQDTPGFIVSRIALPCYGEALRLPGENVANFETIDLLVKSMDFRMGPI